MPSRYLAIELETVKGTCRGFGTLLHRHEQAVPKDNTVRPQGRHPFARQDDPRKVERVCGREANELPFAFGAPYVAQLVKGIRQGILLACETCYEAPAPHQPAGFEAPQRPEDFAPRHRQVLA